MRWNALDLIFTILASYRLTHVLVFDKIAAPVRALFPKRGWFAYLVRCYWCAGVWISAGLVAVASLWPTAGRWIAVIFAVAGGQAAIESLLHTLSLRSTPASAGAAPRGDSKHDVAPAGSGYLPEHHWRH